MFELTQAVSLGCEVSDDLSVKADIIIANGRIWNSDREVIIVYAVSLATAASILASCETHKQRANEDVSGDES